MSGRCGDDMEASLERFVAIAPERNASFLSVFFSKTERSSGIDRVEFRFYLAPGAGNDALPCGTVGGERYGAPTTFLMREMARVFG